MYQPKSEFLFLCAYFIWIGVLKALWDIFLVLPISLYACLSKKWDWKFTFLSPTCRRWWAHRFRTLSPSLIYYYIMYDIFPAYSSQPLWSCSKKRERKNFPRLFLFVNCATAKWAIFLCMSVWGNYPSLPSSSSTWSRLDTYMFKEYEWGKTQHISQKTSFCYLIDKILEWKVRRKGCRNIILAFMKIFKFNMPSIGAKAAIILLAFAFSRYLGVLRCIFRRL